MEEKIDMTEVVNEVKQASEDDLKKIIEQHFDDVRTQGMKIGAAYIAAAVYGTIEKNLKNGSKSSLRDYQRAMKGIIEIMSVQLQKQDTQQNDFDVEDTGNDGTAE